MNVVALAYLGASIVAVVGGIAAFVRWAHPHIKARRIRERAKDFAILGGPIIDPLTGKTTGVQPPIGQWMSDIKGDINHLAQVVGEHAELRKTSIDHEHRIKALEDARTEQMITKAESAQMWRALADKDPELLRPGFDEDDDK